MNTPSQFLRSGRLSGWVGAVLLGAALMTGAPVSNAQPRGLPDFTELVEQVGPSVVNIRTMERVASRPSAGSGNGGNLDEEMQEFFRRFGIPMPGVPRVRLAPIGLSRRTMSSRVVLALASF